MTASPSDRTATQSAYQPYAVASAWLDLYTAGANAWISSFKTLADAWQSVGRTQAQLTGQMAKSWANDLPHVAGAPFIDEMLREELAMAGMQGERLTEAAQRTMRNLNRRHPATAPVPLPE